MAKADVQNLDIDWPKTIGAAITRAIAMVGWSQKEAAGHIGVDASEFGKWCDGTRRPQFDKLFAVQVLQGPLVLSLSKLARDVEVVYQVLVRMPA